MSLEELQRIAAGKLNPRVLSKSSSAGSVAAAILTDRGNVYCGVNIDTPCGMGFCAEHAAAAAMITAGESRIVRLVAVKDGEPVPPCGCCRELICQLDDANEGCEVLLAGGVVRTVAELLPERWN